ncbi:DUF2797 domain-containing protein [Kribbella catacumbae]|uniref:DUF2797 domain-containing protein n=1 Tax=Kribbella catacumbae TaxID=460086 RepID=UPI0003A0E248|nr:DUF2797 domain-containing protein [Kribbella catacumbae]
MSKDPAPGWRVTGISWGDGTARLEWSGARGTERVSPLGLGTELSFVFGAERKCIGFWRSGRRLECSTATVLAPGGRSPQCADCHAMERSNSIATDTRLDDPRPFSVYLAHHGSVIKVGITAAERGEARLLEQGALASTFISTGSLLGARRIENLLMTTLNLPDRVSTVRKRRARDQPGSAAERGASLIAIAEQVSELPWPDGQSRGEIQIRDHTAAYGLPADGLRPDAGLQPVPGGVITGRIACAIGPDLYLETSAGLALLDTHLLAGWALGRAAAGAVLTVPLEKLEPPQREQDALF